MNAMILITGKQQQTKPLLLYLWVIQRIDEILEALNHIQSTALQLFYSEMIRRGLCRLVQKSDGRKGTGMRRKENYQRESTSKVHAFVPREND